MIGFMLFLTPIDEERLLKKYCPNASSQNDCESSDLFFLFVIFLLNYFLINKRY